LRSARSAISSCWVASRIKDAAVLGSRLERARLTRVRA
jgi:hypothetical protein